MLIGHVAFFFGAVCNGDIVTGDRNALCYTCVSVILFVLLRYSVERSVGNTQEKCSGESLLWEISQSGECSYVVATAVVMTAWSCHYLIPTLGDFIPNGLDKCLQYSDLGICN